MTVLVTPAQKDLARLGLELADRLGEPRDPRMVAIAEALPAESPSPPAQAFNTQLELARRSGLMEAVAERSVRGTSNRAAVRQVLAENPELVGRTVLANLALAKAALGVIESREAEKARLQLSADVDDSVLSARERRRRRADAEDAASSGLPGTAQSEAEARGPVR